MHVEILGPAQADAYEAFLMRRQESMLYHSWRYQCLLQDLLGCHQQTLLAIDPQGQLQAALPLMSVDGPLGTIFNSLPYYGSNGGLIGEDQAARATLVATYNEIVKQPGVAATTLIENPLTSGSSEGIHYQLIDHRIGQLTPLPQAENAAASLMKIFHYKTRNTLRKAEKLGVRVSVNNQALPFLVDVHEQNMREIGGIAKSRHFFEAIGRHFRPNEDYQIYIASQGKQTVAALLVFYYNRIAEYYTPVVRKEFRDTQGLSAAIFHAMCEASARGCRWWNWGGTWLSQASVHRFKSRWGTQDVRYKYFTSVGNSAILNASRNELLDTYPNFFTVPFSALCSLDSE